METENVELNKDYWDNFYKSKFSHTPSQFCVCVLTEIPKDSVIVELGSGNGRDSHYFASQGYQTVSLDLSHEAIKSCKKENEQKNIKHASFIQGDISQLEDVSQAISLARSKARTKTIVYYSRFVMHSIDNEQEDKFLNVLSHCMKEGESVYFEFRSIEDALLNKHFGGHYRRCVDTDLFSQKLNDLGLKINYKLIGKGMAKYKEEDPFVTRIIAEKT